jgi:arylsulfatase A-like enzyme
VAPPTAAPPPPSVVVISLDTLRADHLSCYGYPRPTSPAIDARLVAAGTTFTQVSTVFPLTSVAHVSLFTALRPGVRADAQRLAPGSPAVTLAERLRDAGYATVAFTEGGLVAAGLGLGFGFDRYVEREFWIEQRGERVFRDGADWVAPDREPFLLFLHTYKVHAPYVSGDRYRAALAGTPAPDVPAAQRDALAAYDRAIREADDQVAGFLDALDRSGLAARTLVVLLSDHGEAFDEHGVLQHGTGGHEEQLHVPLVLRGPGVPAGRRVDGVASLVDVVPTVLDLLGLPADARTQGTSLRPALQREPRDVGHPVFFSWIGAGARGVRAGRWKLLETAAGAQAFDVDADPHERAPLDVARAGVDLRALAAAQATDDAARRAASARAEVAGAPPMPDGQTERVLRALGYL